MSTKIGSVFQMGYWALKFAIITWTAAALFAHGYYWTTVNDGADGSGGVTVIYGDMKHVVPDSAFDFAVTSVVTVLLVATFWFALQLVRRLERADLDYSDVILQLARFATALCLYSFSKVVAITLIASVDYFEQSGEKDLQLLLGLDQVNLLIISFVFFLVGKALRMADRAVQESQTFL